MEKLGFAMTRPRVHDEMYIVVCLLYVLVYICRHLSKIELYYIYDEERTVAVYSLVIAFFTHKLLRYGSEYESPGDFLIFISDTYRLRKSVRRRVDFGLETLSVGCYSLQPAALLYYFYLARACIADSNWNFTYRPYPALLYSLIRLDACVCVCVFGKEKDFIVTLFVMT